jgi:hypothetical protein
LSQRNIAAFTAREAMYPPYVSLNDTGAGVEIIVRDRRGPADECGQTSVCPMSYAEFREFVQNINAAAARGVFPVVDRVSA